MSDDSDPKIGFNESTAWEAAFIVFDREVGYVIPPFQLVTDSLHMKAFGVNVIREYLKRRANQGQEEK